MKQGQDGVLPLPHREDKDMKQLDRLRFLNRILLSEMPEYRAQAARFPQDAAAQRRLLRSLMNLRPPMPLNEEFLRIQDAVLSEERGGKRRGRRGRSACRGGKPEDRRLAGGYHPAQGGRCCERRQLRPAGLLLPLPRLH